MEHTLGDNMQAWHQMVEQVSKVVDLGLQVAAVSLFHRLPASGLSGMLSLPWQRLASSAPTLPTDARVPGFPDGVSVLSLLW